MTDKSKPTYFNQPLVIKREEIVRSYDSKNITWEKRFMPELVENYKRIRRKEYCDPYFWVVTEVEKDSDKMKTWMMDMEEQVDNAMQHFGLSSNKDNVLDYVKERMDVIDEDFITTYTRDKFLEGL